MLNFIVNPKSGGGLGNKNLKKITKYCNKNNIIYTVHMTSEKGHATRIAKALVDNKSSTIVAVGGDGTFHEVLNGINSFEKTTLGFIASGRGNDFARAANLSTNPIIALKHIIRGEIAYVDYIDVSGVKCLNAAGTGLDISVLERTDADSGKLSYLKSLIYCLKHFEPYKIEYTKEGQVFSTECIIIGVCNGRAIGNNIRISPASRINDGRMNIVIMNMPKDGKIFRLLPKFTKGKHLEMPVTNHFLCEEIDIKVLNGQPIQLDGEIYHDLPFNCKIVKGGVKTFTTFR